MKFAENSGSSILFIIVACCILFLFSCGKKGDPTLKSYEKPLSVKDVKALHREDEIIISWSYPSSDRDNIKGFYIYKAEIDGQTAGSKGYVYKKITFLKSDASQFRDKKFELKKLYLYRINAYSLRNVISDDSPDVKVVPYELPLPPAGLSYRVTNDSLEIIWSGSDSSLKYNIYSSYEKGKYSESPKNRVPLKEELLKDRIDTLKIVYYTVRAFRDAETKEEGYPSEELEVNPALFTPSSPVDIRFIPSPQKVYLMWNENPETWVKGYRIYRKRLSESDFMLIGEAVTPTFTDKEPLIEKTFYHITAFGPKKESAPSKSVVVNPLQER
ncbi:MAG: hypothetical protein C0415_02330 [Thermodesulfovibrio sp.]|nr:hypothetical protein [Thermodesulfovibrio sp.]